METTREEIYATVRSIIADYLGADIKTITETTNLKEDLKADSLDEVEVIMAIEDEFDITISDDAAEKVITVSDAVDTILQALSSEDRLV